MTSKSYTQIPWKKSLQNICHPWVQSTKINSKPKQTAELQVAVLFTSQKNEVRQKLKNLLLDHEIKKVQACKAGISLFQREEGYILIVQPLHKVVAKPSHDSELPASEFALCRDSMGSIFSVISQKNIKNCEVVLKAAKKDHVQAVMIGLELSAYNFKRSIKGQKPSCDLFLRKDKGQILKADIDEALATAVGVNLSRHLVNLPSNWLYPQTYAELVKKLFQNIPSTTVKVWGEPELKKNNMGLILAVGSGSYHAPVMIHIKYRPAGGKTPVAIVGKGITFDTGGTDLKPSAGMRLMKKDMGGSASSVGIAYAISKMKSKQSFDIYLAVAENCIDGASFVAGDIIEARNGRTVEVHNTDAEGRLVVADVLDVAITQTAKNKPKAVIDLCTLTGAIKVGLGSEIAGFFSNNDRLSNKLLASSEATSERMWRMPLFPKYKTKLSSNVADMVNCSSGFGGAITAALFLQEFVGDVPWAHYDIYSWQDSASGALLDPGGSGQMVQALVHSLKKGLTF